MKHTNKQLILFLETLLKMHHSIMTDDGALMLIEIIRKLEKENKDEINK